MINPHEAGNANCPCRRCRSNPVITFMRKALTDEKVRLYNAAPDLLAAAEYMLPLLDAEIGAEMRNAEDGNEDAAENADRLMKQGVLIRAAIARARGEE